MDSDTDTKAYKPLGRWDLRPLLVPFAEQGAKFSHKPLGYWISVGIVIAAAALGLGVLYQTNHFPRTDDAEVFANFIGIAPQVEGPILRLNVRDNQFVKKAELLFEIDERPYQLRPRKSYFRPGGSGRASRGRAAKNCGTGQRGFGFASEYP